MPAIPPRGSEPGIGWNLVREVARRHRVWAITRRKNEAAICCGVAASPLPNLQMVYVDLPKPAARLEAGPAGYRSVLSAVAVLTPKDRPTVCTITCDWI